MQCPQICVPGRGKSELSKYSYHCRVFGQNLCRQLLQAGVAREDDKMTHQDGADPSALPSVNDDKCHLGSPWLEDDVSAAADDDLLVRLICERDDCDMIYEINLCEEGALTFREMTLHREEATLQRLSARFSDRREHVSLVLPTNGPNFDSAAIAEDFTRGMVRDCRHRLCGCLEADSRLMSAMGRCGLAAVLIWIKTIA